MLFGCPSYLFSAGSLVCVFFFFLGGGGGEDEVGGLCTGV